MKSERVVSNPENHGWEEVNGKWIWASGRNTGHITDGDTEGQIATWHDPANAWTPQSAVIVDGAGVTFGSSCNLPNDAALQFQKKGGGVDNALYYSDDLWVGRDAPNIKFRTNGDFNPRLTIDSSGNATFSGHVGINESSPTRSLHVKGASDQIARFVREGSNTARVSVESDAGVSSFTRKSYGTVIETESGDSLTINSSGNATFSGEGTFSGGLSVAGTDGQTLRSGRIWLNRGAANYISAGSSTAQIVFQIGGDGIADNVLSLMSNKNAVFEGRIFKDGGTEVLSTRDLIETLSTLRASTLDETVDVRQALASACDKLIEKFESMQEVATQEIEE